VVVRTESLHGDDDGGRKKEHPSSAPHLYK